jgi:23S rRNA pseudouridine2605 synthase
VHLANNISRRHGRHTKDIQLPPTRTSQRIAKLLARAGVASRREIERMIREGRVAIDGKVVETPATLLESTHGVTVDGNPVKAAAPARLYRYHKPAGVLTAERDPKGRPTIYDRLPTGLPRLMPVGRLDMNTEGLLLLTTDGELKRELELPATGVERVYRARTFGDISQEQLEKLFDGVEIEGIRYGPIDANLERRTGRNQWIELRLREGKNREVRRVLEHLGLRVSRLIRIAYGPFPLADLAPGAVDEIRQHDLVAFRKDLSAPGYTTGRPAAIAVRPKARGARDRPAARETDAAVERDQRAANRKPLAPGPAREERSFSRGMPVSRPPRDARRGSPPPASYREDRTRARTQTDSSAERDERVSARRPSNRDAAEPRAPRPVRGRPPRPTDKEPRAKQRNFAPRRLEESSEPRRPSGLRPPSAKPNRPGKIFKPRGPRGSKPPGPRRN